MRIPKFLTSLLQTRHAIPLALIVVGVIGANAISLSGKADPNPLLQRAELTVSTTPGILGGRNTIDPNDGFTAQALGYRAAHDWLGGTVPYWNHYEGVGTPLAGEMQSAAFFPLTFLLTLSNGLLYFHIVLEIIAGAATYWLLIKLGLNRKLAVFGGLAFAFNGTFAWLTNAAFNPIAFLPVLLLGIESAYRAAQEGRKRGWLLIPIALAFSLYAGFPETAYLNGLLGGLWAVVRFYQLKKSTPRKAFAGKVALGALLGMLLAAPILAAFYGYIQYANIGGHAAATTTGVVSIGLSSLFMPYIFGPIFGLSTYDPSGQLLQFWSGVGGYVALSLIVLAIFGAVSKGERLLKRALSGWVVVTMLGTYGLLGIMHVLNMIPGIASAAFYRYIPPSFEFVIVVLAAFGIDALVRGTISKKVRIAGGVVIAALVMAAALYAVPEVRRLGVAPHSHMWAFFSVVAASGVVATIFAALFLKNKKLREYVLIAVALAEIAAWFMIPQLSAPRQQQIDTRPVQYLQQHLGEYRFFTLGPIQPNYGAYYKLSSININDLPIPKTWSEYVDAKLNTNVNPLIFTGNSILDPNGPDSLDAFVANFAAYEEVGVKYVVAPKKMITPPIQAATGLQRVFATKAVEIFELANPKPYFEITKGDCIVRTLDKDTATADCKTPATLLRREQFMDGWTAAVNNRDAKITPHDTIFQQISLPAGVSDITYHYLPAHIFAAYAAMGVAVLVTGAVYADRLHRCRTEGRNPADS